jgi:phosphate transport system permease protein
MIQSLLPPIFEPNLSRRQIWERIWRWFFRISTLVGIIFLSLLMANIINQSFGYIAIETKVDPSTLQVNGLPLEQMGSNDLIAVLENGVSKGRFRTIEKEKPLIELSTKELYDLVWAEVVKPKIITSWSLSDSILKKETILTEAAEKYPDAKVEFVSWINPSFITQPQSSDPLRAGVRTAIFGSLWTVLLTILVAIPLGIGAAIYLEEYAVENTMNRIIQTNINNLAGVPSIIYGMLGLAIFVRTLGPITSGALFGLTDPATANGRTIISGGLTLALLVLPLIIINAQEAIRAVPDSLRQASYGIGATKWQTVWYHVLPVALPGILTGTILSISRAMGETAPLVVIGAATFITFDPNNIFSKFTTLPIQIYQWTARPQPEFRNLAAAAILVLLVILLSLNAIAIIMRNRSKRI